MDMVQIDLTRTWEILGEIIENLVMNSLISCLVNSV